MRTPPPLPPSAWASFLEARLALIAEWTDEGQSIAEIVRGLSVDPGQIRLLQETIKTRRLADDPSEKA